MTSIRTLLAAGALLAALPLGASAQTAAPQSPANPDVQANQRESKSYDAMLKANPGYRNSRAEKECGPITDDRLRQQCMASFPPAPATPAKRKPGQS